jgi:hypothetical protein
MDKSILNEMLFFSTKSSNGKFIFRKHFSLDSFSLNSIKLSRVSEMPTKLIE